jgi:AraC-like DNA-binding protein
MSRTRHSASPQIRASSVTVSTRWTYTPPPSDWAQLVFTSRGAVTVTTAAGALVAPAHDHVIWVPPGAAHTIELGAGAALRRLHIRPELRRRLPRRATLMTVTPLLREILLRALRLQTLDRRRRAERNLIEVLLDELTAVESPPIELPTPTDPRAAYAAKLLRENTGQSLTLAYVARASGASTRTIERLFRNETGIPFAVWRLRARILRAIQLLGAGESVTAAAIGVGYDSTSAFVAAFRRTVGVTPGRYFTTVS